PGILVGFIEETEALGFSVLSLDQRQRAVAAEFARYFGPEAAHPTAYFEKNWGEDAFCRGIDGSYWSEGVWTPYGPTIREPFGRLHWAGTETAGIWNGKMEGALVSAERVAEGLLNLFLHGNASSLGRDARQQSMLTADRGKRRSVPAGGTMPPRIASQLGVLPKLFCLGLLLLLASFGLGGRVRPRTLGIGTTIRAQRPK